MIPFDPKQKLGGGFKYFFMFTPNFADDFQFDEHIFQKGLVQPPTRIPFDSKQKYRWRKNPPTG